MLDGADNRRFGITKTGLENNMTCCLNIYQIIKDKTVVLLNNYHVGKQHIRDTSVK